MYTHTDTQRVYNAMVNDSSITRTATHTTDTQRVYNAMISDSSNTRTATHTTDTHNRDTQQTHKGPLQR